MHSPAGGQGMNLGIEDAVGLGEPLSRVLSGEPASLLDEYAAARRRTAERTVSLASRLTDLATASSRRRPIRNRVIRIAGKVPAVKTPPRLATVRPGPPLTSPTHIHRKERTMRIVNDQLAVKVRLTEPTDNGFLVLAAEIGGWAGPLVMPSRARRRLLARVAALCVKLADRDDVAEAIAFRGVLRPPGEGSEILCRAGVRPARYDVVVLVRTTTVRAIDAVRADAGYRAMVAAIEGAARHTHQVAAGNAARIADVDHGRDHWFLFNYFHCDDAQTVYDVWEYTAGWFQNSTALPNSTLTRPLPGEPTDYSVINHASWPTLGTFLPSLLFRPSFRSFVLANFKANDVAAQPIIYRRLPPTG